jgi:hypothetical protein
VEEVIENAGEPGEHASMSGLPQNKEAIVEQT